MQVRAKAGRNTQLIPPCFSAGVFARIFVTSFPQTWLRDRICYRALDYGVAIGAVVRSLFRSNADQRITERATEVKGNNKGGRLVGREED